jgi:hypothetical protein
MPGRSCSVIVVSVLMLAGILSAKPPQAPDAQASPLADQLKTQYKLAKVGLDATGWSVVQPGTVLTIQKGGILGVPPANPAIAPANFKDGELHAPNGFSAAMVAQVSRQLTIGEKVYIIKMDVHSKSDKIALTIIECDSCNGTQQRSSYKSEVDFQFPMGYLDKPDVSQVQDVISQVLAPDASSTAQQPAETQQQQPAPSQPAPEPQAIQIGQTIDQVKSILGQPEKTVDLGKKQIYVYKDLKITFIDGKVSDVQ